MAFQSSNFCRCSTSYFHIIFIGLIFLQHSLLTKCQQATSETTLSPFTAQQNQRQSTSYDGVTPEKYITYLKLDGSQKSTWLPLQSLPIANQSTDYTILLWFKPGDQWGSRYQYAFSFQDSLQCYFTDTGALMCDSQLNGAKLIASNLTSSINENQWAHITLIGKSSNSIAGTSSLTVQSNAQTIATDQNTYVALQQIQKSFMVCLGGCNSEYIFIGGLREFAFFNVTVPQSNVMQIKNQFFIWDPTLIGYYRFTEVDFMKDFYRNAYIQSSSNLTGRDYLPNDVCNPFVASQLFHQFYTQNDVAPVTIDGRWAPQQSGWEYTVNVRLYIQSNSCSQINPQLAKQQCYLVLLNDSFMLYQPQPNLIAIYFFNNVFYYEIQSLSVFAPQNQWINVQVAMDQYNGYQIQVYDIIGRLISQAQQRFNLGTQAVSTKQINIFSGYRGFVKSLTLLATRQVLPMVQAITSTQILNTCLMQLQFSDSFNISNQATYLQNQCTNSKFSSPLQFKMAVPLNLVGSYNSQLSLFSGSNLGLLNQSSSYFDGVACNDGYLTSAFLSQKSYYLAQNKLSQNQTFQSGTAEFWFKTPQLMLQTTYLIQLFAIKANVEMLSIMYNATNQTGITCTPYAESILIPSSIGLKDYVGASWTHISCSFDQLSLEGTLFYSDLIGNHEYRYITTQSILGIINNDVIQMYIGNNRFMNSSTNMMMKEVRLWGQKRSEVEIRNWRFHMVDPRTQSGMLSYIRFSEGGFQEFNFASIIPQSGAVSKVSFSGIGLASSQDLVICPLNTYYNSEQQLCFTNPLEIISIMVYPTINNTLSWVFDSTATQFVNEMFKYQMLISWTFQDPILQSYLQSSSQNTNSIISIPGSLFREESYYTVSLTISDSDSSFSQIETITFVPINCQYYALNGQTAFNVTNNYTQPQEESDISFTIDLIQLTSYCSNITFFNQLRVDQFSYTVQPTLPNIPNIEFFQVSPSQVMVTIPAAEQSKFDMALSNGTYRIILSVKLTSSVYQQNVDNSGLTFQNLIYTLRFMSPSLQTVIPSVTVLNDNGIVLSGENAVVDASISYITQPQYGSDLGNLSFSWVCSDELSGICNTSQSSILNISFSQFQSSQGQFQKYYLVIAVIDWTTPSGVVEEYRVESNITWINVIRPIFTISSQNASSESNTTSPSLNFEMNFLNPTVQNTADLYNIQWSLIPNVTNSSDESWPFDQVNFTVYYSGLQYLTSYQLTATAVQFMVSEASYQMTYNFTTSTPPFGGSITGAQISASQFNLTFWGWTSLNLPLQYDVWSTDGSSNPLNQLTNGLQALDYPTQNIAGVNLTFALQNSQSIIVDLIDMSGFEVSFTINIMMMNLAPISKTGFIQMEVGDNLPQPSANQQHDTSFRISLFLVLFVVMSTIGLLILVTILDAKDAKALMNTELTKDEVKNLHTIATKSGKPISYWKNIRSDFSSNQSLFARLYYRCQPFIDIYSRFDTLKPRVSRLSAYMLQVSLYSLICTLSVNQSDAISMDEIKQIVVLGFLGIIILFPFRLITQIINSHIKIAMALLATFIILASSFMVLFHAISNSPLVLFTALAAFSLGFILGNVVSPVIYALWATYAINCMEKNPIMIKLFISEEFITLYRDLQIWKSIQQNQQEKRGELKDASKGEY